MSKTDKKICIWSLSDGKPGHSNQTEGLIQALSRYREIELVKMPILSRYKALLMITLKRCVGVDQKSPDLIIGTGHRTHLSLLAYKRCFGGSVVTMMSPSLPNYLFDLCLIPRHDKPKVAANIIETIGAINRILPSTLQSPDNGLILIGGPSKHYRWDTEYVLKQIDELIVNHNDIKWTVANSRRTPEDFNNKINAQFPAVTFVLAKEISTQWLPKKMQESGRIWVTEDSVSMVYEALTAGAKTGIIRLPVEKQTRVTKEIDRLVSGGYLSMVPSYTDENMPQKKLGVLYEADRCSKLLLDKLDL